MAREDAANLPADGRRLSLRLLDSDDWPVVEDLFGEKGACGGCWCMWWRVPRGGKLWKEVQGKKNRLAFRKLIQAGEVHAVLAFDGDEPAGWCCFGPRSSFPRAERVKACARAWSEGTWSIVCFYIPSQHRGKGIGSRLLKMATEEAFAAGAVEVEGYPVTPAEEGKPIPAAFAWTGVPAMFEAAGFQELPEQEGSRRLFLKQAPARRGGVRKRT
jgi:GNAT superfamily N-acetyltransferase